MIMMIRNCLFDLFLSSHDQEDGWMILGYIFLRTGIGVATLYLVESFPLITSIEKAPYLSALLLFGGSSLLFLRGNKFRT